MTLFLRLATPHDKEDAMRRMCAELRANIAACDVFEIEIKEFSSIPGSPFAYWSSEGLRKNFRDLPPFEHGRKPLCTSRTSDVRRF